MRIFFSFWLAILINPSIELFSEPMFRFGTMLERVQHQSMAHFRGCPVQHSVSGFRYLKPIKKKTSLEFVSNSVSLERKFLEKVYEKFSLTRIEKKQLFQIPKQCFLFVGSWNFVNWPLHLKKHYKDYFSIVSSVFSRVIPAVLSELHIHSNETNPVIHYRLSDVPFCRCNRHHLQYYKFYTAALDKIQEKGIDVSHLTVITNHKHYPSKKVIREDIIHQANKSYLNDFISFLEEKGHKVTVKSGSVLQDFADMVKAPALISASSIFSFNAGLARSDGFISPLLGEENVGRRGKNNFLLDGKAPLPNMLEILPLFHSDAKDYYDTPKIFKKLRQN